MKTRIAGCLVLCALVGPAAMAASNSDTQSDTHAAAGFVPNSAITAKVKANLSADRTSNLSSIDVDTDKKGEVWLSGTVDSQSAADNAVEVAKQTKGVTAVHSYIEVKKAS
jgi:hyperosmotically inducible periplasmic protein